MIKHREELIDQSTMRSMIDDPCDDWSSNLNRRWTPVNDPRNRHARRADPNGHIGRGLRYVPPIDDADQVKRWALGQMRAAGMSVPDDA